MTKKNYVMTMELRLVKKTIEVRRPNCWRDDEFEYLEQKWVCPDTGEFEWRPVPTTYVTERLD